MCPRYILSDNGTKFKNQLMDQVLQQLSIDHIFSVPYNPQSNGKLAVFHKYLKPTLKKVCKKDPTNWDKYLNQVFACYRVTPNLATTETPFFLVYSRDPNLPLHQLLEQMQCFLGDPESGWLNLEAHQLTLAIAKKALDENHFWNHKKTMDRESPSFKLGDRVYFKNKQPGKWDLKWRPGYRIVHTEWWTLPAHWKLGHGEDKIMQCKICGTQTTHWVLEHWHTTWQSWEVRQPPCQLTYHHTQQLKMNTWLM